MLIKYRGNVWLHMTCLTRCFQEPNLALNRGQTVPHGARPALGGEAAARSSSEGLEDDR